MQHYFNPALIADLKAMTFQGIVEIQENMTLLGDEEIEVY